MTTKRTTFPHRSAKTRGPIRYVTAALCAAVGVLYLILLVLVADAEAVPGATDNNTYGAYLFLAVPYLVGGGLLVAVDRRVLWAVGAVVQVFVIGLFLIFGVGVFGPGLFDYAALSHLHMQLWAAGTTGVQVILFGLLCYLAMTPVRLEAEPCSPREVRRKTRD